MLSVLIAATLLQTTKLEPVLGGIGEVVAGIRPHPAQILGLYMRRSRINALIDPRIRQAANDPWIRVGETTTSVKEAKVDGMSCLMLESVATREILTNNPMEGQMRIGVERRITRTRRLWVAEDGSIVKNWFEQSSPDRFTVEMLFGNGFLVVNKTVDGKVTTRQIDLDIDPILFENEFLTVAWAGKVLKKTKPFATLDPFVGGTRLMQAEVYGPFAALEGTDPVNGFRVEIHEGKQTSTAWVTNDGRLLQYDLASGDRLIVEPKVGDPGISKVQVGRGGG
ncbi:MAG: hypothetical protein IT203_07815 [Fimbriimonadaceae bacterium]|nr:hypothetical protein [Fimbriimonadaceae bacterium]